MAFREIAEAFKWCGGRLWDWQVVSWGSAIMVGLGASALFGDEYAIAASFFFVGITWFTAKCAYWEETRGHQYKNFRSGLILLGGAVMFASSLWWVWHRKSTMQSVSVIPPSSPAAVSRPLTDNPVVTINSLYGLFDQQLVNEKYIVEHLRSVVDNREKLSLPVNAAFERYGNHYSLAIYIPHSSFTLSICQTLARDFPFAKINSNLKNWGVGMRSDDANQDNKKAVFSGHVMIYNEDGLTLSQEGEVAKSFERRKMTVEFRDSAYAADYFYSHPNSKSSAKQQ